MRADFPIPRPPYLPPVRPPVVRYFLALTITGLALALTLLLSDLIETRLVIFTLAVMVSAWYGGWRAGLLATALSVLAGVFLLPRQLHVAFTGRAIPVILFVLLAILVCWFNAAVRSLQEALSQAEENFRSLIQNAPLGICRCRIDGELLDINPTVIAMLGHTSISEVFTRNLLTDICADAPSAQRLRDAFASLQHFYGIETEWKRRDDKRILVRISGRPLRGPVDRLSFELVAEDVSEHRALEQRFRQAQKMEAVGRLAGGVAHDFNNLLMVISGYTQLLLEGLGPESPLSWAAQEVQKAADRAASLTRQLLAFSRKQVLQPEVLDLNSLLAENLNMLPRLIGEDIELITKPGASLGKVKADRGQIEQVIMNLAVNARDAMLRGGQLTIETANVLLDESTARSHPPMPSGEYIMLAVSDTGSGMDQETLSHIFEPFFTTKGVRGTGLGLSTVYGIVKQSEGFIWVYSEAGRGTTFKIYLPRVAEQEPVAAVEKTASKSPRGLETVLLVEDEPTLRELVRGFLERQGYTVLQAENGSVAMEIAARHPGPIHMLLTDMIMPGMSGHELAQQLVGVRPRMRVIYMSGYTEHVVQQNGALESGAAFLQKPFTREGLTRKIREVLEQPIRPSAPLTAAPKGAADQLSLWREEGRRAPRFVVRVPLRYRLVGEAGWHQGLTENISRSGVLFRAEQVLNPPAELEISLILPAEMAGVDGTEVVCRGEIVRAVRPAETALNPAIAAKFLQDNTLLFALPQGHA